MKQQINEIKRMQQLAGILKENMSIDAQGNIKSNYDNSFNAKKKYMETPPELVDMLEEDGVGLGDEIYIFFEQSLSLDDLENPEDEDTFKDITLGKKENPNFPVRTNRDLWLNKKLFQYIQNADFLDSSEKIQEVMDFYYFQPFSMTSYFTTEDYDSLEEAKEEWEEIEKGNRILTYEEYKRLYDEFGEDADGNEWD
jgi:hypothetical protein